MRNRKHHPLWQLGKLPARADDRNLMFAALRRITPRPPEEYDFDLQHLGIPTPMFANDRLGCCVIAARAHQTLRFEDIEQEAVLTITDKDVEREYFKQTGGADSGLVMLDSLKAWRKRGWRAAGQTYKIRAFAEVNRTEPEEVKAVVYADVGAKVGIWLPLSAQTQLQAGKPWTVTTGRDAEKGSWGGHCLAGNTPIPLLDGSTRTISELELSGLRNFWIYGSDENGKILPTIVSGALCVGINDTIEVTLDNGTSIRATPEHLFLKRDGSYIRADKLRTNDSLMPLYQRKTKDGYEEVLSDNQWLQTHRIVGDSMGLARKHGLVVHHCDFNKTNNSPANLKNMEWYEHRKLHQVSAQAHNLTEYSKSPAGRKRSSKLMRQLWSDPDWRARALKRTKENLERGLKKLIAAGRCGTQCRSKKELQEQGHKLGISNRGRKQSKKTVLKRVATKRRKFREDALYANRSRITSIQNITKANNRFKQDPIYAEWVKTNLSRARDIRWHGELQASNHKVVSVKHGFHEKVYDLVNSYPTQNFAAGGIFVHNCVYLSGYTLAGPVCVTWGRKQQMDWNFWLAYCDEAYAVFDAKNQFKKNWIDAKKIAEFLEWLKTKAPDFKPEVAA